MTKQTISLKAARINAKKNLREAAEHINVSEQTIINYENGKSVPSVVVAIKLADFYHIPIDNIFFGQSIR